jgi:lysophospholipase L1-like esterase
MRQYFEALPNLSATDIVCIREMIRLKRLTLRLLLSLSSILITAAALETWLAMARIGTKSIHRYVPGKGSTYMPGVYYRHTKEGFSEGYINSHGFRDYERTHEKPPNTFRILVLGDSYVEALQVALADSFPALLEKNLNTASSSTRFEVLNMGQSGFGTADEYMRYLTFGIQYSPDLILLAFLTGNDFSDNSKFLTRENTGFYFEFDKNGNLMLDRSLLDRYEQSLTFGKRLLQRLKQESYLANFISERLYLFRLQLRDSEFRKRFARQEQTRLTRGIDEFSALNIYLSEISDHWKQAHAITAGLLRKFRNSVEANGSRFVLVTLSNSEQVHPEIQRELRGRHPNVVFDFEQPDRVIEQVAKRENIDYLKLMPVFREYHLRTGHYLHGFGGSKGGHWNKNGHRLAADKIFEFLKERDIVPLSIRESEDSNASRAELSAADGRHSHPPTTGIRVH